MAINYRAITGVMAGKGEIGTYQGRHQVLRQGESPGPGSLRSITLRTGAGGQAVLPPAWLDRRREMQRDA